MDDLFDDDTLNAGSPSLGGGSGEGAGMDSNPSASASSSSHMPMRTLSSSSSASGTPSISGGAVETDFTRKKKAEIAKRAAEMDAKHEAARKEMARNAEKTLEKMRGDRVARIAAKAKENRTKQQEFINSMKKPQIPHLVDLEAQSAEKERFRALLKSGKLAA